MTETCNHCDGDLVLPDDIDVVSVICPKCGNLTGVCANCSWNDIDREIDCNRCPFNIGL